MPAFANKYSEIDTKKYDVACVGDVHGDPSVLVQTIESMRYGETAEDSVPLFIIPPALKLWANSCDCTNSSTRLPLKDIKKLRFNVKNLKKPFVFVLLGDILDNVRPSVEVHYANEMRGDMGYGNLGCGGPVTQLGIMIILVQLHLLLKTQGGYVLWIAGNHDIANVDPSPLNAHICKKYAPLLNAKVVKKTNVQSYATCDHAHNNAFSQEHVDNVLKYMEQIPTFTMGTLKHITSSGKRQTVLLVHGYLSMSLIQSMTAVLGNEFSDKVAEAKRKLDPLPLIAHINKAFSPLFFLPTNTRQMNARNRILALNKSLHPYTPWWCRAFENGSMIDDRSDVPLNVGIDVVVKGHDVHSEPKHLISQFSPTEIFQVYCMDTGSSVSMGPHNKVVARILFCNGYDPEISVIRNKTSVYYGDTKLSPCTLSNMAAARLSEPH